MSNFDDLKLAVEALTGGKNTVLLDDVGLPSIMVVWPKQKNNALFTGGSDVVHPGSIVNMVEKICTSPSIKTWSTTTAPTRSR